MHIQDALEQVLTPEIRTTSSSINILRLPKLMQKVGLGRSSIYLRVKNHTFPAPITLGGRAVGWLESEIDAYLLSCVIQSRNLTKVNRPGFDGGSNS